MFKVEAFVEDKKLGDVLRSLAGLVRGQPSVVPVINVSDEGKGAPKANGDGRIADMMGGAFRKAHRVRVTAAEIGGWLKDHGRSPMSTSYITREAIKHGYLKADPKKRGEYVVIPRKAD